MDGSGLRAAGTPGAERGRGPKGTTALDRFSQDLTAKAKSGEMDPMLGRDDEIRQIIDVLMRRRQNNPILDRRGRCRQDGGRRGLCAAHRGRATCRRRSRACSSARSTSA